jgi:hypothetical protein
MGQFGWQGWPWERERETKRVPLYLWPLISQPTSELNKYFDFDLS